MPGCRHRTTAAGSTAGRACALAESPLIPACLVENAYRYAVGRVATLDERVRDKLTLGETALVALHYWGLDGADPAYARRSAAVMFGQHGGHPSLVAIVDLIDNQVTAVVPAAQW